MVRVTIKGITAEGTSGYDPGSPPSAYDGGTPPSWDPQIETLEVTDWDEVESQDLFENFPDWLLEVIGHSCRATGSLPTYMQEVILESMEDEILEALCE